MDQRISGITDDSRASPDQPLVLYVDNGKFGRYLNRLMLFTLLAMMAGYFGISLIFGFPSSMLSLGALLTGFAIGWVGRRKTARMLVKPVVEVSRAGIVINTLNVKCELIPWEEIKDVRAYKHPKDWPLRSPVVGITPVNMAQTSKRFSKGPFFAEPITRMYRLFGMNIAPINIEGDLFTPSAYEVATEINNFRDEALKLAAFGEQTPQLHLTE